jgi:hypothetical protein
LKDGFVEKHYISDMRKQKKISVKSTVCSSKQKHSKKWIMEGIYEWCFIKYDK